MSSNRSNAKSKEMESDDQDSSTKTRRTRSSKPAQAADTNAKGNAKTNKRTVNKNGLANLKEEADSEKDKTSKNSVDNHASDHNDKPPAKRSKRKIQISAESAAMAVSNIEPHSSPNDDTADEEPLKISIGKKAPKRAAVKSKVVEESAAPKGKKGGRKTVKRVVKKVNEPEDEDDEPEGKDDEPEDRDDEPEDRDDEPEGEDDEPEGEDDEPEGKDDEPEGKDDEPEDKDDEPKDKVVHKATKGKSILSKVRDGDYDLSNDVDDIDFFNLPKTAKNATKSKKGSKKTATKPTQEDDKEEVEEDLPKASRGRKTAPADSKEEVEEDLPKASRGRKTATRNDKEVEEDLPKASRGRKTAPVDDKEEVEEDLPRASRGRKTTIADDEEVEEDLPKTSRGRKTATRKAGAVEVVSQKEVTADVPLRSSRAKQDMKKTNDKIEDSNDLTSVSNGKAPVRTTRGGKALAKKSAKISVQLKEEVISQDDEEVDGIASKTARVRKVPVKKTDKTTALTKGEGDSEVSDDNEDDDLAPKTKKSRKAPVKKAAAAKGGDGLSKDGKGHKSNSAAVKDKVPSQNINSAEEDAISVDESDEDSKVLKPKKVEKIVNDEDKSKDTKDSQDTSSNDTDHQEAPPTASKNTKSDTEIKAASKKPTTKAPVDPECVDKVNCSHVYCENDTYYDAMLNQTNVQNNNNKFYLLQVLEDDAKVEYSVWLRWGRVGAKGTSQLTKCGSDLVKAKKIFEQKFQDKTKNQWSEKSKFEKVAGKYDLLAIDYSTGDHEPVDIEPKVEEKEKPKSKLDLKLQSFIELIFNIKAMEDIVMEMKYDAKKAPLGKLTTEQVTAGYAALKKVEECIMDNKMGKELIEACNTFYTRIPHVFGMKRPPLIQSAEDLALKVELLKMLGDIQVAMTILNEKVNINNNPIDSHYESLKCNMKPISKDDSTFSMINDYLQNTHAETHRTYNMELVDLFDCSRVFEESNYKDVGNRMLLWHGSRLTNAVGILKQGLRIAPPEAPSTGYMFGKGVYFADMSSKSANYCYTSRIQNEGILYLCEVSVGTPNKLLSSDYNADKLPDGCQSVLGQGSVAPDPKMFKTLPNGTLVPMGKGIDSGVKNPSGYTLNYNEYIIYDVNQIKLKYVLRVKFLYKY